MSVKQLNDEEIIRLRRILDEQSFCYLCDSYVPNLVQVDYKDNQGNYHSHVCKKCEIEYRICR